MPEIGYRYPHVPNVILSCEILTRLGQDRYRIRYEDPYVSENLTVEVSATDLVWPRFGDLVF